MNLEIRSSTMVLLAGALLSGCGAAWESPDTAANAGSPAPSYEVTADGRSAAWVTVRSAGAYVAETGGRLRGIIPVSVELENGGDTTVVLDPSDLRVTTISAGEADLPDLALEWTSPTASVSPKAIGTVFAAFALPEGVEPGAVTRYSVRWAFSLLGEKYVQMTDFQRDAAAPGVRVPGGATYPEQAYSYYPYYPYYPYFGSRFYGFYPYGYHGVSGIGPHAVVVAPHAFWPSGAAHTGPGMHGGGHAFPPGGGHPGGGHSGHH